MYRDIANFSDIMSALGITSQKKFETWYESYLQGRETMELDMDGFEWDESQIGFDYRFAEVTDTVSAMATIVDLYSPAVARGRSVPIRTIEGYIPRQKREEVLDENDYRTQMEQVQQIAGAAKLRNESPYDSIEEYLSKNLLEFAADFPVSHAQSINYQIGQMKSEFGLNLTDKNNPNGLVNIGFTAHVPEDNTVKTKYYTVKPDGSVTYVANTHPILDINKRLTQITRSKTYGNVRAEIEETTLQILMGHPDFVKAIGYLAVTGLYTASASQEDADARATEAGTHYLLVNGNNTALLADLFKRIFPAISELKVYNGVVAVPQLNTETKIIEYPLLDVFSKHVLLLRPAGIMGKIKNVVPIRPDASHKHSYMFDKRGIIDYWYDVNTGTQHWRSELTALAVPDRPGKLYRFILGEVAEADDSGNGTKNDPDNDSKNDPDEGGND